MKSIKWLYWRNLLRPFYNLLPNDYNFLSPHSKFFSYCCSSIFFNNRYWRVSISLLSSNCVYFSCYQFLYVFFMYRYYLFSIWYLSAHRNRRSLVSSSKLPFLLPSLLLRVSVCREISHSISLSLAHRRDKLKWIYRYRYAQWKEKRCGWHWGFSAVCHKEWWGDNYNILFRQINKNLTLSLQTPYWNWNFTKKRFFFSH